MDIHPDGYPVTLALQSFAELWNKRVASAIDIATKQGGGSLSA